MSAYPPARIHIRDAAATDASIELDGHDVANLTRAFTLDSRVGDIPVLTVEFRLTKGAEVDAAGAIVRLGEETRTALIALGWTPPAELVDMSEFDCETCGGPCRDEGPLDEEPIPDIEPDPSTGAQR